MVESILYCNYGSQTKFVRHIVFAHVLIIIYYGSQTKFVRHITLCSNGLNFSKPLPLTMPDLKKKKMKHLLFVIDFFTEAFASVECLGLPLWKLRHCNICVYVICSKYLCFRATLGAIFQLYRGSLFYS
jgi:hypothetical protein